MKKQSISERYKSGIAATIILLIICAIMTIYTIFNYSEILNSTDDKTGSIFCLVIIFGSSAIPFVWSIIHIIISLKDYKDYKNKNYVTIIGKVVGFKENRDTESGVQINDTPIVYVFATDKEIVLSIGDEVSIGNIYTFNYLKNTKVAEVVKK